MKYLTCQFSPLANHSLRRIVSSNRLRIYVCETLVTWVPKSSPPVRPLGLKTQPGWSKHLTREKYIKRKDPFLGTLRLLYSWSRPRNLLSRTRRWSGVERAKKNTRKIQCRSAHTHHTALFPFFDFDSRKNQRSDDGANTKTMKREATTPTSTLDLFHWTVDS